MVISKWTKRILCNNSEIHGQNDNQNLLDNKLHINYLDGFSGEQLSKKKQQYQELYHKYLEIKKDLKENLGDEKEKQRKLDLLQYQVNEIEEANLKETEEETLEERRTKILNAEKIAENLQQAESCIGENAIDCISTAIRALEKIETLDENYAKASSNLKNMYYELQEISRDITSYAQDVDFEEAERKEIEERLDLIHDLKRKYGNNIAEILQYKEEMNKEIKRLENLEQYHQKQREKLTQIENQMEIVAQELHKIRTQNAENLSIAINKELEELEMKNAKIKVKVEMQQEFLKNGKDLVTFFITTNIGEEEKELSKIASGGEMSRTMLAIKKVLADTDKMPILIFDEIDTGISGKAANSVAKKLKAISKNHQVMCISHLPNIAAIADFNYFISKNTNNERTKTQIKLLKEKEVIEEIARISSGEVNEISIKYATELRSKKAS